MKAYVLPERVLCLNCGGRCYTPLDPSDGVAPGPGDAVACGSCTKVFILADDVQLRDVTSGDLAKLPADWIQDARYYIERAKDRGQA